MTEVSAFKRLRGVLLVAGVVFAALPVGSALANTTIGQTGGNEPCASQMVFADPGYVVPAGGGTITSFSFQSTTANAGNQLDFLVLRPTSTQDSYTVVGSTGLVTLAGTGLETFPAKPRIAAEAGDILGFWMPHENLWNCGADRAGGTVLESDPQIATPEPSVGAAVTLPGEVTPGDFDLNESANLATGVGAPPPHTGRDWSAQHCGKWLADFEAAHKQLTRPQALAANHVLADHSCVIRVLVPPGK